MVARGVAGGHGHDRHADPLGAVVKAEAAGEEAVAEGHVEHLAGACAGRDHHARHHFAPHGEIAGRVADHGRLALGARRGVDAGQLAVRDREQAEGIVLAEIALPRERQAPSGPRGRGPRRRPGARGETGRARPPTPRSSRSRSALQRGARGRRLGLGLGVPDHARRSGAPGRLGELLVDRAMVAQADGLALDEEHRAGAWPRAGAASSYSASSAARRAGSVFAIERLAELGGARPAPPPASRPPDPGPPPSPRGSPSRAARTPRAGFTPRPPP